MKILQFLPTLDYGDAIGNHTLKIKSVLREIGYRTEIYAARCHPKLSRECRNYKEYKPREDDIIFYHFSIGDNLNDFVNALNVKKIVDYHNITPWEHFVGYDETSAYLCKWGIEQLKNFRNNVVIYLGDSEYNAIELESYNLKPTDVLSIFIDFKKFEDVGAEGLDRENSEEAVKILFVGRLTPNKKIEDIIKVFYFYSKYINNNSKLILVGSNQLKKYFNELVELTDRLKIRNKVVFTGKVELKKLVSYYKQSDIFLCMSEHEGFCVPLVEAMYFQVPIIAYKSTAIPYTLGNAGILIKKKDYIAIAEMINLIIEDENLRRKIIKKQNERLKDFDPRNVERKFKEIIEKVVSEV